MKKLLLLTSVLLSIVLGLNAQVAINTNGGTPSASAMLDVSSTSKGILLPRMTSPQRKAIVNPEPGLLVYDTDHQTIYLFEGQKWRPVMAATEATAPLVSRQPEGAKSYSEFGYAADIYDNYAVAGAPADSAKGVTGGAVYVFIKDNGTWSQMAKLSAPSPTDGDRFGASVSIFGDVLVVGAPNRTVGDQAARGAIMFLNASAVHGIL